MIYQSIQHMLATRAETRPDDIAIQAPDRTPLTYKSLYVQVDAVVNALNLMGIGRNDRVGIALPNGPEMAVAFLGVAAGACSAPLNMAYRKEDFEFYLTDLNASALVVEAETDSPARAAAQACGVPLVELRTTEQSDAGVFTLESDRHTDTPDGGFAGPDDIALILHTSGTTSRPKIVPLTHANLCHSARNHVETLQLTEQDCCLNIMPLFHIHALISALLSSLSAGGRVICTPGFSDVSFLDWLETYQPTWYTSAPTMHQAVLDLAIANPDRIKQSRLYP